MKLTLCFAILLATSLYGTTTSAESTGEMLAACRGISEVSNHKVWFPPGPSSSLCWGAFAVLQKLIYALDPQGNGTILGVCAPSESTRAQLIAIFVRLRNKPGDDDE